MVPVQSVEKLPDVVVPPFWLPSVLSSPLLPIVKIWDPIKHSLCPACRRVTRHRIRPAPSHPTVHVEYVKYVVFKHQCLRSSCTPADEIGPQLDVLVLHIARLRAFVVADVVLHVGLVGRWVAANVGLAGIVWRSAVGVVVAVLA